MIMPVNRINYAYLQNSRISKNKSTILSKEPSFEGSSGWGIGRFFRGIVNGIHACFNAISRWWQLGNIRAGAKVRGRSFSGQAAVTGSGE